MTNAKIPQQNPWDISSHPDDESDTYDAHAHLRQRVARLEQLVSELRQKNQMLEEQCRQQSATSHHTPPMECAFCANEDRYERAVVGGRIGIWDWDIRTNEMYLAPNLKAMLGYADHEIRNHLDDWGKRVAPDDVPMLMQAAEAHMRGETPIYEVEHRMLHKDGSIRWFIVRGSVTMDEHRMPLRMSGTHTDITERKAVEEELRRSQQLLTNTFASMRDAVFILDADNMRILDCNPAASDIFGYSRQDMLGYTTSFLHPDSSAVEEFKNHLFSCVQQGEQVRLSARSMKHKDGYIIHAEHSVMPIQDHQGNRIGWVNVVRDITDRILAEHALRESEEKFRCFFEQSLDSIMLMDAEGIIIECNSHSEQILGLSRDALIGRPIWDVQLDIHDDDKQESGLHSCSRTFRESVQSQNHSSQDNPWVVSTIQRPDGSRRIVQSVVFPIQTTSGLLHGTIRRDITEQERLADAAHYRAAFTRLIVTISTRFLTVRTSDIDREVHDALQSIGKFTDTDCAAIILYGEHGNHGTIPYQWFRDGMQQVHTSGFSMESFRWVIQRHAHHDVLSIPSVASLSPVPGAMRSDLELLGIKAMLAVPMVHGGRPLGELAFIALHHEHHWPDEINDLLRVVGEIIINALNRRRTEEALQASEKRFRAVFENAGMGIILVNSLSQILQSNHAFQYFIGYTSDELQSLSMQQLTHPDDFPADKRLYEEMIAGHRNFYSLEKRYVRKDGTISWGYLTVSLLRDATADDLELAVGIVEDISERKHAEEALRESEQRYRTLFETSPGAILLTDLDSTIRFCNQPAVDLFGYESKEDLRGKTGADLVFNAQRHHSASPPQTILQSGNLRNKVCTMRRSDGSPFPAEVSSSVITDSDNNSIALTIIVHDISERERSEIALSKAYHDLELLNHHVVEKNNLLRAVVDGLDQGLVLLDSDNRVQMANQALATLLGTTPTDLMGSFFSVPGHPFRRPDHRADVWNCQPQHLTRYQSHDGTTRILDSRTIHLPHSEQSGSQAIVHIVDVTQTMQLQTRVIENERFAANGRLAASMAHEINTPLQSLELFLELVRTTGNDLERASFLSYIQDEMQRIGRIVRQVLELYRPSAAVFGHVDINALLERLLLLLGKRFKEQGIMVEHVRVTNLPPLHGRADELMQVLLNLLVNAIDAMPNGGYLYIRTLVNRTTPAIHIVIRDTGIGIRSDIQATIFDCFVTTKEHGTGMGLAISRQIMQQYGGAILVKSTPNVGSTFTIVIPL